MCCWGVCVAVARQAQEAGRRVSRAREWAELQVSWLRAERQVRTNRTRSYMNSNGELTETENVILLRKQYGVITEFLRMNVILTYFCNGQRRYGYGGTATECWKPHITVYAVCSILIPNGMRQAHFLLYLLCEKCC